MQTCVRANGYIYQLINNQLINMAKRKKLPKFKPKNLSRYPRLDTVLMVEKAIYEGKSDLTITRIWHRLPKKVLWTTYTTILDYLQYSGKIIIEEDKTITWLWAPKLIEKIRKQGVIIA